MTKHYSCSVIRMSPGVVVPPLRFGGNDIGSYFANASGGSIAIDFRLPADSSSSQSVAAVGSRDLHFALTKTLNNTTGPVTKIGLIFAAQFADHPELLGLMFDLGFSGPNSIFDSVPREGCAVFVDAVRALRPNNLFNEELTYTAIHELGHVFNLGHMHDPLGFMLPSQTDGSHLALRDFAPSQKALLVLGDHAPEIEPGGNVYSDIGMLSGGGDYNVTTNVAEGPRPFGLEMRIDVAQREFWAFEPVELDLEIRVASGLRRTFAIPNTVDPGFATFNIYIDEPDGERRRYRSPVRLCSSGLPLTITNATPFRRDIPLFGQAGGYTFCRAGIHSIHAVMDLPGQGVLRSNVIDVNVLPHSNDQLYTKLRRSLTARDAPELLFYRPRRARDSVVHRLEAFADEHDWTASASSVRFAIARTLMRKRDAAAASERRKLTGRALRHLRRVADHEKTGSYRRYVAECLLKAEKLS